MDVCSDSMGDAQIFSALDSNSGYWQIRMDDKDIYKVTFVTHHGLFRYTRMLFELKNAPATFQGAVDVILVSVERQQAYI